MWKTDVLSLQRYLNYSLHAVLSKNCFDRLGGCEGCDIVIWRHTPSWWCTTAYRDVSSSSFWCAPQFSFSGRGGWGRWLVRQALPNIFTLCLLYVSYMYPLISCPSLDRSSLSPAFCFLRVITTLLPPPEIVRRITTRTAVEISSPQQHRPSPPLPQVIWEPKQMVTKDWGWYRCHHKEKDKDQS